MLNEINQAQKNKYYISTYMKYIELAESGRKEGGKGGKERQTEICINLLRAALKNYHKQEKNNLKGKRTNSGNRRELKYFSNYNHNYIQEVIAFKIKNKMLSKQHNQRTRKGSYRMKI